MLEAVMTIWIALASALAPTPTEAPVQTAPVVSAQASVVEAPVEAPAPVSKPAVVHGHVDARTDDGTPTPLCEYDEAIGRPCVWDADSMGNRQGTSFVAGNVEGVAAAGDEQAVVTVVTPEGHTFTYGGSATEAADLALQSEVYPNPDYPEGD